MTKRQNELTALGAIVVLVAYDEPGLLAAKVMKGLEVPFTLVFDPERVEYARWGLGRTGLLGAMLSPELNWRYLKLLLQGERFLGFAPDMFQLGADFILDRDQRVAFVHRMRNNGDRPEVALLFAELERAARG